MVVLDICWECACDQFIVDSWVSQGTDGATDGAVATLTLPATVAVGAEAAAPGMEEKGADGA